MERSANPLSHKDYRVSQGVEYPSCRRQRGGGVRNSLVEPLLQHVSEQRTGEIARTVPREDRPAATAADASAV